MALHQNQFRNTPQHKTPPQQDLIATSKHALQRRHAAEAVAGELVILTCCWPALKSVHAQHVSQWSCQFDHVQVGPEYPGNKEDCVCMRRVAGCQAAQYFADEVVHGPVLRHYSCCPSHLEFDLLAQCASVTHIFARLKLAEAVDDLPWPWPSIAALNIPSSAQHTQLSTAEGYNFRELLIAKVSTCGLRDVVQHAICPSQQSCLVSMPASAIILPNLRHDSFACATSSASRSRSIQPCYCILPF